MGRGRVHSREFKLTVVRAVVDGGKSPAQACREFELANSVLDRWRKEYAERGEEAFTPRGLDKVATLEERVAELERFCGQLALENMALKKGLSNSRSRSDTR
jgi:transposase-like protein